MDRIKVESSNLESVGYDEVNERLEVAFLNGRVYAYYGVPSRVHHELMNADSHGVYFNAYVKNGGYKYEQIA